MSDTNNDCKQTAALERIAKSLEAIAETLKTMEQEGVRKKPPFQGF